MKIHRLLAVLSIGWSAALAGCATAPPAVTETTPHEEQYVAVATYAGSDAATGARIAALLESHGIHSVAAGSKGYTVNVLEASAEEARRLITAAITDEHLSATAIGD